MADVIVLRWVLLSNRLVDLDEIFYEDDIEDDLDSIQINSVASTGPKWWTFKLLWWVELLNWLVDLDEILYGGDDVEDDIDPNYLIS
jgi:hypothetical protein